MDVEEWSVFVDGKEIHNTNYNEDLFDFHRISHFYIGGDSKHQSAAGGHVTVKNVMLYNEMLSNSKLYDLHASKVTIPSLGVEKQPTEQVASTDVSVEPESKSEETTTASHEKLNEDDTEKQEEGIVHDLVLAAPSSTVAAGSSVPESATAVESAENFHRKDKAQLSEGETFQQSTLNEDNGSMQRDSEMQTQDLQTEESTEATDVETSPESNDAPQPEKEEDTNDMNGESMSPVGALLSMDTATETVDSEQQVQKS
ncbi:trans-sialidase, putative [Trypanosoma cruzi]|nr:trans-sialidase, putative [Trypanosoma cruzi]